MWSRARWLAVSVLFLSFTTGGPLFAAPSLFWDPGATNNASPGGTGTWNTSSWWNGTADTGWITGSNATFGGAAGIVSLSAPISANGVTFSTAGYTIAAGNPLTVSGGGITVSASGTTNILSGVTLSATPFFSVANGGTLALGGDLTRPTGTSLRFVGTGTTLLNTVNGTAASSVVSSNNGILGGWAFVDNGNSTYSWATVNGSNAVSAFTTTNTTSTPAPTDNWAPQASVTLASNSAANSLIEIHDIHLAGFTMTVGGGGIIFQSNNFWMQDSTGTLTSGLASGELFVHTPNTGLTDTEIRVNVTNNGATPVSLIKDGPGRLIMQSENSLGNTYTGNTIVNAGILELRNGVGATGELGSSPNIIVNSGATLALNAADVLGYTINGKQQMVINSGGTVSNITAGSRVTIANLITMTGGVLTGSGTGDANGAYSFFNAAAGVLATSDAFGNPSIISAKISPQTGNILLTVNRGPANPAADLNITAPIIPNGGNGNGITKAGNGILLLSAANTFNGSTAITSGTVALGPAGTLGKGGAAITPGGILDVTAYPGGYNLTSGVLTGGRTSSFATDVNGSLNVTNAAVGGTGTNSTFTISGSLAMSGGSLNYGLGDIVATPNGSLTLAGTDYVVPQSILAPGNYNLFTYNSGTPIAANLLMAGPNSGGRQAYLFSASAGTVSVAVTGSAASLFWRGGTWDNQISTSWFNASSGSADVFFNGDTVTFDDSAGVSNGTVAISGLVQPGAGGVNVSNTAVGYVFSGTGSIVGGTSLRMSGPGSLTINNSNTYTGGTNLNGGLLVLGNSSAIGSGRLTIGGGTLDSTIVGGGTLATGGTLAANNAQTWNGDFTFIGTQSLNMGTGAVTLGSSRSVTVNGGTLTVAGILSDSGSGYSLRKAGPGVLQLTRNNTYTGATTVNQGTLVLGAGGGAGGIQGQLTINPGALVQLTAGDALGYTIGQQVTSININGATLDDTVNANQGFTSSFFLTAGTMASSGGGFYNFSGGTYGVNTIASSASSVISGGIDLRGGVTTFNVASGTTPNGVDLVVSGVIRDGNSLTMAGPGLMQLTGVNTYSGTTTISGGTLQLGDGTSGHDGALYASGGTNGVINNTMLAYNLFGNQSAAYAISGSGGLTKLGQGQLTLNGANSYTGTTTVVGGVLNINGADSSAAFAVKGGALYVNTSSAVPTVSVAGGATFGGTGSLAGATANVANSGILDFGQVSTTTVYLGGLTYAGSSTLKLGPVTNFTFSPVLYAGALTTAGQININANQGAVSVLSGTYDLVNYTSIAGTGTSAFHLASVAGLSPRQSALLLNNPGQVDLVVNGFTPFWSGSQPDWVTTNAWTLQPGGTPTTFLPGDADVFDDTAGTGTYGGTVSLNSSNVAPGSVTFSNLGLLYTVSGNFGITGSGALAVQGGGSVTILNSNSYTGVTSVSNGQLNIGNGGATGSLSPSSAITLGGNGQLAFSRSNTAVQGVDFGASSINGAGGVVQNGPGLLIFTASNGYTGLTSISDGTLQLGTGLSGQDGALTGTNGVNDNATLSYNLSGSQAIAYSIGGGGSVEKAGPGLLTMSVTNSYTGGTTVDGGTLSLNVGGQSGTLQGALTINPGATVFLPVNNALGYGGANWVQNITINGGFLTSGINSDNGWDTTITMTGGTLNTTVAGGYFAMGTPNSSTPPTFNILASNATALISANLTDRGDNGSPGITFNVTRGSAAVDLLVSGSILTANGGTPGITLNGNGITVMTGTNTYPGPTVINGGLLQLGNGTLGFDGSINTTTSVLNNGQLVYAIAGTQTAAYPISGNGSLLMTGTGTVVLSASNSYTGSTSVNAGRLYANGPLASVVTVNAGLFGGRGTSPGASVATGGSIEGGFNGVGTLTLGLLGYSGSGTFTTNGYSNYPAFAGAAPLNVTGINGLSLGGSPVVINLGGPPAGVSGTYHLIQYSGGIGGIGFGAFTLGSTGTNTPRGQVSSFALANDPGYVDVSVSITPVVWTGSLSTAWNSNDTLPAPMNWSYAGSGTNFQVGDDVQFDNSTVSGGTANISNGTVLPGGVSFNNDAGHPYTLTGLNGIGGTGLLLKNGPGSLTIANSNGYTAGTNLFAGQLVLNNNNAIGAGPLTIGGGTLSSTVAGITLPNNVQNWNGAFTANGGQGLNLGTGAVTLGSSLTVTVSAGTVTVGGAISDGGNAYSLTKAGPGSLTLSTANTFTGGTIVNGGTLQLDYPANINTGALASPTVTVNAGGFLALNGADVLGYIVGREVLTINDGTVSNITAAGRVTFQNPVTMTGGTISGPGAGDGNGVYSVDPQNGADGFDATSDATGHPAVINATSICMQTAGGVILNVTRGPANPPSDMTISSTIIDGFGANPLIKNGNGILLLTGNNTYTAVTTINGGTLQLGNGQAGQDGSIATTSGVANNAALVFDIAGTQTAAYAISGTGSLTMDGPGMTILSGSGNTYTGGTFVTNGELQVTNPGAIQDGSNLFVGSPGTIFAPTIGGAAILSTAPLSGAPASAAPAAAVPEPGTLAILAAVGAVSASLVVRRRRRDRMVSKR